MEPPLDERSAPDPRERILEELVELLSDWGAADPARLRSELAPLLAAETPTTSEHFRRRVESTGTDWGYHPPDPLARGVSRVVHGLIFEPGSALHNAEALERARSGPVLLLGNHLSFVDVNALDYLMSQAGYADVAERLTALVGPKVYAYPLRRLASLCFGTIKLAQSASRASGEARMPRREIARLAKESIQVARERRRQGDHLLIFVEGSRSRSGAMQRALSAVGRYLEDEDAVLVPWGIFGTERLFPIGEDRARPARVSARLGAAVEASRLLERCDGNRTLAMDTIGFLIAALLPPAQRGVYGEGHSLEAAHAIARDLVCPS